MVDRVERYERDRSRVERDTAAQAWGIIAVLAVLALVGWGIWAATRDNVGTTGTTIVDRGPDIITIPPPSRETIVTPGPSNTYNTQHEITSGGGTNMTGP